MNIAAITERTPISRALRSQISLDLEQFHRVFDVFWTRLNEVYFDPTVKTACVTFFKDAKGDMFFGPEFWLSLNDDERLFVVLHECLHVLLDHGVRSAKNIPGATHRLVNIAQDITINEMIVDLFGFPRNLIRNWQRFCWIDTCFPDPSVILPNQPFVYYLKELLKNPPPDVELMDDHEGPGGGDMGDPDETAESLAQHLTAEELEALLKSMEKEDGRGTALSPFKAVLAAKQPQKINFNHLIAGLKRSKKAHDTRDLDSFAREGRRFGGMTRMILPGKIEAKPEKTKLIATLFFDVSGSCGSYIQKFYDCVEAFRKEEKLFDLRVFAFDTRVEELKPGQATSLGGGTAFDIIERKNREIQVETGKYPDCVVVLTDGHGSKVSPIFPARWVWLLTDGGTRRYIPYGSRVWPLKSVVFE